ncbi:MAG: transposase, partial [Solirubrobacteraceae bacterium]
MLRENPVRGNAHAGLGGGLGETERIERPPPRLGPTQSSRKARRRGGRPGPPRRVQPARTLRHRGGKWLKGTRYRLLKDTAKQIAKQLLKLAEVVLTNKPLYRAFLLYGELRNIYRLPYHEAVERLEAWLAWASRSRLKPFVKLARTIRKHKAGVLAAIELNLSNGRLEAPNSKVRLLSHRAYGFHSADALIAMI